MFVCIRDLIVNSKGRFSKEDVNGHEREKEGCCAGCAYKNPNKKPIPTSWCQANCKKRYKEAQKDKSHDLASQQEASPANLGISHDA